MCVLSSTQFGGNKADFLYYIPWTHSIGAAAFKMKVTNYIHCPKITWPCLPVEPEIDLNNKHSKASSQMVKLLNGKTNYVPPSALFRKV